MNEQETAPLPQLEPERCWVCGGPVGEPYTDGDGGPVCCSARCSDYGTRVEDPPCWQLVVNACQPYKLFLLTPPPGP